MSNYVPNPPNPPNPPPFSISIPAPTSDMPLSVALKHINLLRKRSKKLEQNPTFSIKNIAKLGYVESILNRTRKIRYNLIKKANELQKNHVDGMLYVLMQIGCIGCDEPTRHMGTYTDPINAVKQKYIYELSQSWACGLLKYKVFSIDINEIKGDRENENIYLLMCIGCDECGDLTYIKSIYSDQSEANEQKNITKSSHNKNYGHYEFEIFEIDKNKVDYILDTYDNYRTSISTLDIVKIRERTDLTKDEKRALIAQERDEIYKICNFLEKL